MDRSTLYRALQAAAGRAVETFAATAGAGLESERVPPDDHRPWPIPAEPWVMTQRWQDILFAHWRVPAPALRRFLPPGLALDTFEGTAWLGITPFRVTGARLRGLPAVPGVTTFAEVNVRTYAMAEGRPGVVFLSLDAASALAVMGARVWYGLPYFFSAATLTWRNGWAAFSARREHPDAPDAVFEAEYRPVGDAGRAPAGSLAWWLTERYCLYTVDAGGCLARADIHHAPWPIQEAEVRIRRNTLAAAKGLDVSDRPDLAHFSTGVDAVAWSPRAIVVGGAARVR
jgi:uncharacterized protein YqjF (DUF2071 family)